MAEQLFPDLKRPLPQLPSLPYTLFAYREELRRRDAPFLKMSTIKLHLTDNLILHTIKNIRQLDTIEIMNLNREIHFKRKLTKQMRKVRKLEKLGINADPRQLNAIQWHWKISNTSSNTSKLYTTTTNSNIIIIEDKKNIQEEPLQQSSDWQSILQACGLRSI